MDRESRWAILLIVAVFQGVFFFVGILVFTHNLALAAEVGGLVLVGTVVTLLLLTDTDRSVYSDRAQLDREFARIQWRIPPSLAVFQGVLAFVWELVWGSHSLVRAAQLGAYFLMGTFVVGMIVLLLLFPPPREPND